MKAYAYRTPHGEGYVQTEGENVVKIFLPGFPPPAGLVDGRPEGAVAGVAGYLEAYFRGDGRLPAGFLNVLLDNAGISGFTRRVLEVVAGIPYGETRSYGEVASAAGSPRSARAVGNVMAGNPFPVLVPCHRVIRSTGDAGGFGGGGQLKVWMLEMEARRCDNI